MRSTPRRFFGETKNFGLKLLKNPKSRIIVFIGVFASIGVLLLFITQAATPNASVEAEDGQITNASLVDDTSASGGKAVQFSNFRPEPPASGVYTGISRLERASETRKESLGCAEFGTPVVTDFCNDIERVGIGRKYDTDRKFYRWRDTITSDLAANGYLSWTSAEGRFPIINLSSRNNKKTLTDTGIKFTTWKDIANGDYDIYLGDMAKEIKTWNKPAFFIFHHEPEGSDCVSTDLAMDQIGTECAGSAQDYQNAWRHIRSLFNNNGVRNLSYMWDVAPYTATIDKGWDKLDSFYPLDDTGNDTIIDWVGGTPFNIYDTACNWKDLHYLIDEPSVTIAGKLEERSFYKWSSTKHPDKPIALPAYGTSEFDINNCRTNSQLKINDKITDPSTPLPTKSQWIKNTQNDIKINYPKIKMLVYFDVPASLTNLDTPYNNRVDSSQASYDAYKEMVNDPYYNPRNY